MIPDERLSEWKAAFAALPSLMNWDETNKFIALCDVAVPALIAEVERLREALANRETPLEALASGPSSFDELSGLTSPEFTLQRFYEVHGKFSTRIKLEAAEQAREFLLSENEKLRAVAEAGEQLAKSHLWQVGWNCDCEQHKAFYDALKAWRGDK